MPLLEEDFGINFHSNFFQIENQFVQFYEDISGVELFTTSRQHKDGNIRCLPPLAGDTKLMHSKPIQRTPMLKVSIVESLNEPQEHKKMLSLLCQR